MSDLQVEESRVKSLRLLGILDSVNEKGYDDITSLASYICNKPISYINFVDKERHWLKSKVGIEANEVPRELGLCSHAILSKEMTVVEDTLLDDRFKDNALCTGEGGLRFYCATPLISRDGHIVGTLSVADIAPSKLDKKQIESLRQLADQVMNLVYLQVEIKESNNIKQRYERILETSPACIKTIDKNGRLQTMNTRGLQMIEADSLDSVLYANAYDIVAKEDRDKFIKMNQEVCAGNTISIEFSTVGLKGTVSHLKTYAAPITLDNGEQGQIAISHDITEQKRAEAMLESQRLMIMHTSKMSAVGEMAGNIAHEVNNPLSIISGLAEVIRLKSKKDSLDKDFLESNLDKIISTTTRISKIITGLRAISRNDHETDMLTFNLNESLNEATNLCLEKFSSRGIKLNIDLSSIANTNVYGRTAQLGQVFLNLLSNASDAIADLDEKRIDVSSEIIGTNAYIHIIDSGKGIDKEFADKIMDPFFTTKSIHKGTGLGLSISKTIIAEHGGKLFLNKESKNTHFTIMIPIKVMS